MYGNDIEKVKIPNLTDKKLNTKILKELETLEEKSNTHVISDIEEQRSKILKKYLK